MKSIRARVLAAVAASLLASAPSWAQGVPQGTGWTYQGLLFDGGQVANGAFDLSFTIFDGPVVGAPLAPSQLVDDVLVVDGRFTVTLDFGKPIFDAGEGRWLQIAVSEGGPFVTLLPRQRITPAPAAIFAENAANAKPAFRIFDPDVDPGKATLFFGMTDECTLGVSPALPGLTASDPAGLRIRNPANPLGGGRLRFGITNECEIFADPEDASGLNASDPSGLRLRNPFSDAVGRLRFGVTDLCEIFTDPDDATGINVRDPDGLRLRSPFDDSTGRLRFGAGDDCQIFTDPFGPSGINASDPSGFRLRNPILGAPIRLLFGPTDECGVIVDPFGPNGLTMRDPRGVRILPPDLIDAARLRFGATDLCELVAGGGFPSGLNLRDPSGARIVNPLPGQSATLLFGETDDCLIKAGGDGGGGAGGMAFNDPAGFRFNGGFIGVNFPLPEVAVQLPPVPGPPGIGLAFAWQTYSSRRFKENVTPLVGALDLIARLEGVRFDWIDGGRHDIGFIAEDVAEVLPEVVAMEPDGVNARSLDYARITALAVEGIKAQQEELAELKRDNAALRAELEALRKLVDDAILNHAR